MITKGISVIAEHFGLEMQLKQLQEESAELIVAASKFLRKRGDFDYMLPDSFADCSLNLTEELADVLIVAYQIIDLLDAESQVTDFMQSKIERTIMRITEEKDAKANS